MKDFPRAMKLSLCFGMAGAVIAPLIYECYANVSRTLALFLLAGWAVFVGVKLSSLSHKAALLSGTAVLAYTTGMGLICYIIIHPMIVKSLEKSSKYFYLTLKEQSVFVIYALLIMLLMFVVCFARWEISYAAERIRSNSKKVGEYIDNAFSDKEDKL